MYDFRRNKLGYGENRLVKLNDVNIVPEANVKYLGVVLQCDLKWKNQIEAMVKKSSAVMYHLKRLASLMSNKSILQFPNKKQFIITIPKGLVLAKGWEQGEKIEYASVVWCWGLDLKDKTLLERQQRLACKMLHVNETSLSTLEERRISSCIAKYNKLENSEQSILCQFICSRLPRSGKYQLKYVSTDRCKNSFFYYTPIAINKNQ